MAKSFPQTSNTISDLQIVTSTDELFNHVDDQLPMWAEDGDRSVNAEIQFDKAFKTAPSVTLGLTGVDAAHDQNLRFALHAKDVSASGFTIEFKTWDDTHIARASVSWQAVGVASAETAEKPVAKPVPSRTASTPAKPAVKK